MSNGKVIVIHVIVWLIKKIWCDSISCNYTCLKTLIALQRIKMSRFFSKLYKTFGGGIKVKLDLSNYTAKTDLKTAAHSYASSFCIKKKSGKFKNWSW